ncbi:hypothetical protein B6U96_17590 [Archaeoglobales archaeon ex4484_92]|nr:MAG: hypothetical protein B6U96_17590 [Archaeoglobales archaeon ex4484_92]
MNKIKTVWTSKKPKDVVINTTSMKLEIDRNLEKKSYEEAIKFSGEVVLLDSKTGHIIATLWGSDGWGGVVHNVEKIEVFEKFCHLYVKRFKKR